MDLQERQQQQWRAWCDLVASNCQADWQTYLQKSFLLSDFAFEFAKRHPDRIELLVQRHDVEKTLSSDDYECFSHAAIDHSADLNSFKAALRVLRDQEMFRIALRDLNQLATLSQINQEITGLAEVLINQALDYSQASIITQLGIDFESPPLCIIALGKLGGRELNFSSDVDLMFVFPDSAVRVFDGCSTPAEHFYTRVAQRLIQILSEVTAEGFVYRVDTRLRPFGNSGPLVITQSMLENYYYAHGRGWERYALIKARCLSGKAELQQSLTDFLKAFVYRRYVDYSVIDTLRELKKHIEREIQLKDLTDNLKRGPGGIREIEFIMQAFQLIRGGREAALQQNEIQPLFNLFKTYQIMDPQEIDQLQLAHEFLRQAENRLQMQQDRQTQSLPQAPLKQAMLAEAMGDKSWQDFVKKLTQHRQHVLKCFADMVSTPVMPEASKYVNELQDKMQGIWLKQYPQSDRIAVLQAAGFQRAEETEAYLLQMAESFACRALSKRAKARLDQLMPILLTVVAKRDLPFVSLRRVLRLIEAIMRRSAYLTLLYENSNALIYLVELCANSEWISDFLAAYPVLLDELLDPQGLFKPLDKNALAAEWQRQSLAFAGDDFEAALEQLRVFQHTQQLRIAAADIADEISSTQVARYLSELAELVITITLDYAFQSLPKTEETIDPDDFAIVAYGKLGSYELNYNSDLDLVFIYDEQAEASHIAFTKLAQRLIHFLNMRTLGGVLYEVDTRLRPSGRAGLLVSSMQEFIDYQNNKAWLWEHQALVRARLFACSESLLRRFDNARKGVLVSRGDENDIRQTIAAMRQKMRDQVTSKTLDLKNAPGGIIDIEFMVQYLVLRESSQQQALLSETNNEALLTQLQASELDCKALCQAWVKLQNASQRQAINKESAQIWLDKTLSTRQWVQGQWQKLLG